MATKTSLKRCDEVNGTYVCSLSAGHLGDHFSRYWNGARGARMIARFADKWSATRHYSAR